jgi:hypothetical protein
MQKEHGRKERRNFWKTDLMGGGEEEGEMIHIKVKTLKGDKEKEEKKEDKDKEGAKQEVTMRK